MAGRDHRELSAAALETRPAALDRRERHLEARERELSARRSMRHLWWALRLLPTAAIELVAAALLVLSVCVFHGAGLDAATVAAAVVVAATVLLRLTDSGPPRR